MSTSAACVTDKLRSDPAAHGTVMPSVMHCWFDRADEVAKHDDHLTRLTAAMSPTLRDGFGVGADTAAAMLIVFGENPDRIRSEAAFAKLCGACPILSRHDDRPPSSLSRRSPSGQRCPPSGIVRMKHHAPTVAYVAQRRADGRTKRDIIRCLKRFLAREMYQRVMADVHARRQRHTSAPRILS